MHAGERRDDNGKHARALREAAHALGLTLSREEAAAAEETLESALEACETVERLAGGPPRAPRTPRGPGWRPTPEENPLNGWAWRVTLHGADEGPLEGARVAVKDNIAVAGVPMQVGSRVLADYVPGEDATVVTRVLDAGGVITGKATCEAFTFSGGSHTSWTGPVLNPHDPTRMAGGSSSGCAALLAAGDVDLALGGDQGGSISIPSAWCGTVGVKPTFGLVPYTGAFSVDATLDHLGPMARTVPDAARLLEVIAGPDGVDDRQHAAPSAPRYADALTGDARGLTIGILGEGFGWPDLSEEEVDARVREEVGARFPDAGARVQDVSVGWHRAAGDVLGAITIAGSSRTLFDRHATVTNRETQHPRGFEDAFARGLSTREDSIPPNVRIPAVVAESLHRAGNGHAYAKAQRLRPDLRAAYDAALTRVDVLALPAVPYRAPPLPPEDATPQEIIDAAQSTTANTGAFDLTGHPVACVPAGDVDGLPVGVLLVARRGDERTLLRAAHAFEAHGGRRVRPALAPDAPGLTRDS